MKTLLSFLVLFFLCISISAKAAGEQPFVAGSFQSILKEGSGKPLIINFWSYDCPPCLAEMPVLDRFVKEHSDVSLHLVSTDPWDQMKRIKRMLHKYGPQKSVSWVFSDSFVEKIRFSVDRKWRGQLPRTYLVSPNGDVHTISGMVHEVQLLNWYKAGGK